MPRPRLKRSASGHRGLLTDDLLAAIADTGFGDAFVTGEDSWEARCLFCTGPGSGPSRSVLQRVAVCTSVRACRTHQLRLHPLHRGACGTLDEACPVEQGPVDTNAVPPSPPHTPAHHDPSPGPADTQNLGDVSDVSVPASAPSVAGNSTGSGTGDDSGSLIDDAVSEDSGSPVCSEDTDGISGGPRKGSGAWWYAHRLDPIAVGSSMSVLQVGYNIAELRSKGVTKGGTTMVASLLRNMVASLDTELEAAHVPGSTHLVERVLGVRQAADFEFGWCPGCGLRYPEMVPVCTSRENQAAFMGHTCPRCGTAKYKVQSAPSL